jgi:hypothetical protein
MIAAAFFRCLGMRDRVAVRGEPLTNVRRGRAAPGAAGRLAAAGWSERTTRRSPAVTTTPSTRLAQSWEGVA